MKAYNEADIIELLSLPETDKRAVFEVIVRQYSQPLYWHIRRMVISHDDANDILQNTFLKSWSNLELFRGESKISTWLYRIAINEVLNFLQRKKQHLSLETTPSPTASLVADPYFDGDETAMQLQAAINELPEKQRTVFLLKYYQEIKYEDMSEMLGTSVGSLKASYHHAVKKISDFFHQMD